MKHLLTTIVVGLAGIQGLTLEAQSRPKLMVGIVVDQLRTDYLEDLKDMFGNGGFRRLMNNGVYFQDIDYVVPLQDVTAATAILQTGTYPRQNGITGGAVADHSTKIFKPIFTDQAYLGNFTNETYSPVALRVNTITDEVTLATSGKANIHSIAPDAGQAIVLAGHTGNSAFWLNDETGRWSSSTYYTGAPDILQNRNYSTPLISKIDTLKWVPLRASEPYPYVTKSRQNDGFRYSFSRSDKDVYSLYKQTPFINDDITEAAEQYVTTLNLGKDESGIDVLNIGYTLAPFSLISGTDYRYELEDAYLRLDKDLEQLFNTLDKYVGKDNVLVYLVSSGYFNEPATGTTIYRLPGGTFSVKRALSLLNAFLSAKYGNGAYVDMFANGQIFLSHSELEKKNLEVENVARESRDFLIKMSGVSEAYTPADLISPAVKEIEALRLSIDPKTVGDVILEFAPGWTVVDDSRFPTITLDNNTQAYRFPGFIMGPGISPKTESATVEAVKIAPVLAGEMHIRAPSN